MIGWLGWLAAVVVLVSLSQSDPRRLHRCNIVACLMFLVYDVALSLPAMVAMNSVLLCVSIGQTIRLRSTGPGGDRQPAPAAPPTSSTLSEGRPQVSRSTDAGGCPGGVRSCGAHGPRILASPQHAASTSAAPTG